MRRRERGFINVAIALLLFAATLVGVWGVEYIKRVNAEKKFRQNVDQLTISAASFQAMTMNGVTVLNDGIIADDTTAAVVAAGSVIVGIVALIAGGAGLEIIIDGLRASKKIIDVGNKIEELQKHWASLGSIFTYLPYLMFYTRKARELKNQKMIFLPLPFLPDLSTGSGRRKVTSEYDLKIHVSWSLDKAVKGVLKELLYLADKRVRMAEEKEAGRFDKKVDTMVGKPFCKAGKVLFATSKHPYKKCRIWTLKIVGSKSGFYKSVQNAFDNGWKGVKRSILASVDSWDFSGDRVFGVKIPVPAVIAENFYQIQKIGTLAIWENKGFTPVKWLVSKSDTLNIPLELQFARAMPYSDIIEGGVPVVPDWKGIFIPPDLLNALGVKK